VSASDVESSYTGIGKLVHENVVNNTPFVWGYDKLSNSGVEKTELKNLWYREFVGGG
jgi:hypothetical protein